MSEHLGERAELLALGLDDDPALREHAAECPECAERLREAEAAVAALATTLPYAEPPPALAARVAASMAAPPARRTMPWAGLTIAAAAIALLCVGIDDTVQRGQRFLAEAPLTAMREGHFAHVPLRRADGTTAGKAIYALDGSWMTVVAAPELAGDDVVVGSSSGERVVGTLTPAGTDATLFVRLAGRPARVALRHGAAVIASGAVPPGTAAP